MQHSTTSSQQQQQQHQMPPTTSLPPHSTPVQTPTPAKDITPNEQPTISQQIVNEEQQHQQLDQQEIDGAAVENLAKQVSELDVDTKETEEPMLPSTPQRQQQANSRNARQNNNTSYRQNNNSNQRNQNGKQRITIPQTDFDFESSNAKFSKNELLKELMKGSDEEEASPIEQPHQEEQVIIPPPNDEDFYNRVRRKGVNADL
jgi:protein LSM14